MDKILNDLKAVRSISAAMVNTRNGDEHIPQNQLDTPMKTRSVSAMPRLTVVECPLEQDARAEVYLKSLEEARQKIVESFFERFHEAASQGDLPALKQVVADIEAKLAPYPFLVKLLEPFHRKLSPHPAVKHRVTPLIAATLSGNAGLVEYMIRELQFDIYCPDETGHLATHMATLNNKKKVLGKLLKLRPDLLEVTPASSHETLLNIAAFHGHIDAVNYLVCKRGANVAHEGSFSRTPMEDAALNGHLVVMHVLLEAVMNLEKQVSDHILSMSAYYATMNGHFEIVKLLVEHDRELVRAVRDTKHDSLLHLACYTGRLELVEYLVEDLGLDIEDRGCYGRSALLTATFRGHFFVVKYLVGKGANLTARDESDHKAMAIHLAAQQGDVSIVAFLLDTNRNLVHARTGLNDMPLHRAAFYGKLDVVEVLVLQYQALMDIDGQRSLTPLMMAVRSASNDVVRFLMANGCDGKVRSSPYGYMAIHYAAADGYVDTMDILLTADPSLMEAADYQGQTALALAAANGQLGVVDYLVREKRADIETRTINGRTPLQLAQQLGHQTIVEFLLQNGAFREDGIKEKLGKVLSVVKQKLNELNE